jgi:hypothetical protein
MSATLKNKSRQTVVLVLDHPTFATKAHGWQRTTAKFASVDASGNRTVTEVRRSYPGSLTLLGGQEISGLPAAVAFCAQMPELLANGTLAFTLQDDAPVATAPTAPAPAPAPAPRQIKSRDED